ncbi:MAG: hypothetical protein NT003_03570 [Candidatus Magasanikbacteria bacterium]|nr:hypothetical protein [Candidatus Magasanikbacteria bacterium]
MFEPGNMVFIRKDLLTDPVVYLQGGLLDRLGHDAMIVVTTQALPDKCSCGGSKERGHVHQCDGKTVREAAGHSQWLTVRTRGGTVIEGTISGYWFELYTTKRAAANQYLINQALEKR